MSEFINKCPEGCKGLEIKPGEFSGCECKGAGCDCPNHPVCPTCKGVGMVDAVDPTIALKCDTCGFDQGTREAFIEGLYQKANNFLLSPDEALAMLCGTLAGTLTSIVPNPENCPEGVSRANAENMVVIAFHMQRTFLTITDKVWKRREKKLDTTTTIEEALKKLGLKADRDFKVVRR